MLLRAMRSLRARRGGVFVVSLLFVAAGSILVLPLGGAEPRPKSKPLDYNRDIRPILSEYCFTCHGPDAKKRKAPFRLDTREGLLSDLGGYFVVVPGKPDESELLARIIDTDPAGRMPPPETNKLVPSEKAEWIRRWIEEGAAWKDHWSYVPIERAAVPEAATVGGTAEGPAPSPHPTPDSNPNPNPVDRFIDARLLEEGVSPVPEADRITLIRRVTRDLTGLPPTPEEVEAFVADTDPAAWTRLVDRLLASPHHGERMAIYWLDLVRYADTVGYHSDNHRDVAPYRDWVIRAFADDKPFDRFLSEQLAGDLLPDASSETRVGSGYNRMSMTTQEGGAQPGEYVVKYAADRVRNFGTVWLGATLGCAECHDHKYDPYTQRDFYSMAAFFADVKEMAIGEPGPGFPVPTSTQSGEMERLEREIADLRVRLESGTAASDAERAAWIADLAAKDRALVQVRSGVLATMITESVEPRTVRILPRGNWLDGSGSVVEPAVPHFLPPLAVKDRRATRLDLARWLAAPENPLTARVYVNRLWMLFFGQGLARNLDDLGAQGASPTHPELLDWLSAEFRAEGWSTRHIVRLLVSSKAYRRSSKAPREFFEHDPGNAFLARQTRYRLEAEFVRDGALATSGLLCRKVGGRSVKPYQPPGYWQHLNFPKRDYVMDQGEDAYRRGLYTYWQRTFLYPSFLAFDAPGREDACPERPRSNTPLQALVLLNDPVYVEAACAFAERITRRGREVEESIRWAFREGTSREAGEEEVRVLRDLYSKHLGEYTADLESAGKIARVGGRPIPSDLDLPSLGAWISVARAILNLQEVIWRN